MTETSAAVDKGIQEEKRVVKSARGSLERITWDGIVKESDLVIFSTIAGSLDLEDWVSMIFIQRISTCRVIDAPFPLIAPCRSLINSPNVI